MRQCQVTPSAAGPAMQRPSRLKLAGERAFIITVELPYLGPRLQHCGGEIVRMIPYLSHLG